MLSYVGGKFRVYTSYVMLVVSVLEQLPIEFLVVPASFSRYTVVVVLSKLYWFTFRMRLVTAKWSKRTTEKERRILLPSSTTKRSHEN